MKKSLATALLMHLFFFGHTQIEYPSASNTFSLSIEGRKVNMSYMDVRPAKETGKNILLLHGKNFNGYYWKNVIPFFTKLGYRIIIPDQVGWGKSDHPDIHYSFHLLANNTKILLDSLGIKQTIVLGHSMGGMLAARFALMFPSMVEKLILENPIGLEDYKTFVPYQSFEKLLSKEKKATYESYKKYQQSYYPEWKPEYEQYVQAQAADLNSPQFDNIARANAFTYQMIYEQPVLYEFDRLVVPTLLIIGQADRTVVGKDQLDDAGKKKYGDYPSLGKMAHAKIKGSMLKEIAGVGHIPHVQDITAFENSISAFLK
ncbi:alpha/beta fold hydrolase [Ferruginibacter sp. HRS2-29]|uniref:alpha/beta fold hydrolase n=1 Tax=Ferruginibacter sp. HRS2-29 TaxID=2487334 RepID=UPI0020CCBDC7|nr:alpha/beta hydrolase [Ferruginibacter sp. HRS2-29]MCP9750633.1 alpha/beta hydrolase [Ferruginibacter sp. HRS2-29]